ncbi:MAG: hypothetical protein AVDCRST_MAG89-2585 [uncultured Gemmatimonadetes bacterium]|uniref:BIG2 domain-containing protein n=1 Tax=uncultured Gemmatimonadota bacterium TaxID=203437 RepID=A0A6J4LSL9_9BACT|nr:MAG: hypothetical protein AVDCRST_MAG89-2585 [uncultured Gemmatimonadota bacterium]
MTMRFHHLPAPKRLRMAMGALSLLAVSLAASACENPGGTKKREPAGIRVVSGAGVTDTVTAFLPQPLIVEVRDSAGELRAGIAVQFEASVERLRGVDQPTLLLSAAAPDPYQWAATAVTDATGRAVMRVRMGIVAAAGTVTITAPTLGLASSASFTINAGAPVQLTVSPADTAVFAGGSYTLRVGSTDRWWNTIPTPTHSTASSATSVATVSGATVGGQAVGRATLTVSAGALSRTVAVSVVPQGYLLAVGPDGVYGFNLDGSSYKRIVAMSATRSPRWFPGAQTFVFSTQHIGHAFVSDLNGNTRALVQGTNPLAGEVWPHPSRDGQWVYFGGYNNGFRAYPYRVRVDGTGLQLVPGFVANDRNQGYPTTSPTGDRVAYFHEGSTSRDVTMRILNMQTGQLVLQGVPGHTPEWSHGDTIAYLDVNGNSNGPIRLMSSAGVGDRQVGSGSYAFGIDWSPDDRWIAGYDVASRRLEVVQVATGLRIPLPYSEALSEPAWRP